MNKRSDHFIITFGHVDSRTTEMEAIDVSQIKLDSAQIPSVSGTAASTPGEKGRQDPRINPRGELPKAVLGPTGGKPR